MADEYNDGNDCPVCADSDSSYFDDGTLHEMEGTHADDLSCDECGSIFTAQGVCKMNTQRKSAPPWIDHEGEVDPVKKREYEMNDRKQYPDHYYGRHTNRRL